MILNGVISKASALVVIVLHPPKRNARRTGTATKCTSTIRRRTILTGVAPHQKTSTKMQRACTKSTVNDVKRVVRLKRFVNTSIGSRDCTMRHHRLTNLNLTIPEALQTVEHADPCKQRSVWVGVQLVKLHQVEVWIVGQRYKVVALLRSPKWQVWIVALLDYG